MATIRDLEVHAVPLAVDGRVRGSYTIYKDISEQIRASQAERKHAEVLSQLVTELQLRTEQMSLLSEMGDLLECMRNHPGSLLGGSSVGAKAFARGVSGTLYLFVRRGTWWRRRSGGETQASPKRYSLPMPAGACAGVSRTGTSWPEASTALTWQEPASGKCLCVPMVGQGDTLGVLHLEFAADAMTGLIPVLRVLQDSQQRVATTVAGQIALSLASLRLRETLRDQSIRDPLTGLFNRRFMEESLEREMQRAVRKNHPVSVLFIDLDHFKRFNDTFGHDAGDFGVAVRCRPVPQEFSAWTM